MFVMHGFLSNLWKVIRNCISSTLHSIILLHKKIFPFKNQKLPSTSF